ncbi:MAG: hypothetical protein CVV61_03690 [Tenericutes bacterium HGW-Tenericutes-6]|nr:MAG: hypothetical protein CVV61_03690 [Tenericutes bacterium HGW-Tenericutes-6]
MRKFILMIAFLLFTLGLVACKDGNDPTPIVIADFSVLIVDEVVTFNTIDTFVVIEDEITSIDDLNEIVASLSGHIYEQHKDDIRSKTYVLTIYLYPTQEAYELEANDYGYIAYWINRNLETPGLSLHQSSIIFAE